MRPQFKNYPTASKLMFAPGSSGEIRNILESTANKKSGYVVYIIDHFFKDGALAKRMGISSDDICFYLDTTHEPKTTSVDNYVAEIKSKRKELPDAIIGAGGGSTLDMAKAVSILLTNKGKAEQYQGWDLPTENAVYKIAVPTISGTGSEISRTTVLTGPEKKQGINSDQSMFNQVVMDPELLRTVPTLQRFYTGMDCYIHCVESLEGTYLNAFSRAYAEKALETCLNVFLNDASDADLMVASLFGGYSIAYSEVGICHALSYGLSFFFGYHHGEANTIVFDYLDEFYPSHIQEFRDMMIKNGISLPRNILKNIDSEMLEKMVDITLLMERPLNNALGENWRSIFTREKIKDLYSRI